MSVTILKLIFFLSFFRAVKENRFYQEKIRKFLHM